MTAIADSTAPLPLRPGARGDAVADVQRRLAALAFEVSADEPGTYGTATEDAVRRFQDSRGLHADGICGTQTWGSLVEAGYRLGDRFLYLRAPFLRGDDVAELQGLLGGLGFDAGRVDGIFGPRTAQAILDFQRNAGLTTDGICGSDTSAALHRLAARSQGATPVVSVREEEVLRGAPRNLVGWRVAVGENGGLSALITALGRALVDAGAVVAALHHPDGSVQATEANDFKAEAFVGVGVRDEPGCVVSYFGTDTFESIGGRRLAELVVESLPAGLADGRQLRPMRLPVLRETRMPAVVCEVGPPSLVVEHGAELAAALARALGRWVQEPLGEEP